MPASHGRGGRERGAVYISGYGLQPGQEEGRKTQFPPLFPHPFSRTTELQQRKNKKSKYAAFPFMIFPLPMSGKKWSLFYPPMIQKSITSWN
jgi:hypothetical protein